MSDSGKAKNKTKKKHPPLKKGILNLVKKKGQINKNDS